MAVMAFGKEQFAHHFHYKALDTDMDDGHNGFSFCNFHVLGLSFEEGFFPHVSRKLIYDCNM